MSRWEHYGREVIVFKKRHPSVGARPGTLVVSQSAPAPRIRVIQYSPTSVSQTHDVQLDDLQALKLTDDGVTWIDVQGLGDEQLLHGIAHLFGIHPLAMEDVVNTPQRPSAALHRDRLLIICRMANHVHDTPELDLEQVSIVLGPQFVITFQEKYGDVFDPVRRRIRLENSRLRQLAGDYLAYALLDTVVDGYYPILERLGDHLERLEDEVLDHPAPEQLRQLTRLKNRLASLRRIVWSQREMVRSLTSEDTSLIHEDVRAFLRDVHDHCIQTSEVVESFREMATGLMNTYLSSLGQRTNEVMKVLTIMSSIFIPLTFMAGIYGMNFEHMPELSWKGGYPLLLIMMLALGAGMTWFFHRLGWFRQANRLDERAARVELAGPKPGGMAEQKVLDHDMTWDTLSAGRLRKSA